jgi:hypothetical protein
MPTNQDETVGQRYTREHQDYLKLCENMTGEQVADLQLQLHNALARTEALQLLLNTADQRNADALDLMRRSLVGATAMGWDHLERDLEAFIANGHVIGGPVEAGNESEVDLSGLYAGSMS